MLEMSVILVTSLVISLYYSWQIALICLAFYPVLALAGAFQVCLMDDIILGKMRKHKKHEINVTLIKDEKLE